MICTVKYQFLSINFLVFMQNEKRSGKLTIVYSLVPMFIESLLGPLYAKFQTGAFMIGQYLISLIAGPSEPQS